MCGIAGLCAPGGRVDLGRLQKMSSLLSHRGPDDEGAVLCDPSSGAWLTLGGGSTPADAWKSGVRWAPGRSHGDVARARFEVGIAHRRLSIVDLSPAGHQPMCDGEANAWISFNGEIYNWVELRQELESLGDRFTTASDTEVLLAAYARWGERCLDRLNGMFALAIWDARARQLFCARDRFGVKPFYWQIENGALAFASEARALALTQSRRPQPRAGAIRDLLALDWVDHDARTFFDGIFQLQPGHFLRFGERGLDVRQWWSLPSDRHAPGSMADWLAEFEELFTDAVRLRLRADVEVGSCLSGGLDSSAVVTTASKLASKPLHAFTCAYDEGPAFDERPYVRATVEASGAHSHVVVPTGGDFWETFDRLSDLQGEPTAGSGLYSQWKVMELAHSKGLKVLLDGQGGDETLAGYFRYLPIRLRDLVSSGRFAEFARQLGPVADRVGATTALALTFEPWLPAGLVGALRRRFGQGKERALSRALRKLEADTPRPGRAFASHLGRQLAFDTTQRLLPSLLRYEDRNSMAFSIETRLPFLDYRLVEFVFSLPDEAKLDGTTTKALLRRSLAGRIPQRVRERRDKMGFETPADLWLRQRYAGELRRRLLTAGPLHDWLDEGVVRDDLEGYLEGRRNIGPQVWRWLSLESWSRRFVSRDPRLGFREEIHSIHAGQHRGFVELAAEREEELGALAR